MTTKPVIDKQNVDISLKGGVNERENVYTIEWMRYLANAENVVLDDFGALKTRPGFQTYAEQDSEGNTFTSVYRLLQLRDSVGVVADDFALYQPDQATGALIKKGRIPEFSVYADETMTTWSDGHIEGIAVTDRVIAMLVWCKATAAGSGFFILSIKDRTSNNIVKSLTFNVEGNTAGRATMVCVDERYLHIYKDGDGLTTLSAQFAQVDTHNLPSSLTWVDLTAGDVIVQGATAVSGGSVVLDDDGALERFDTTGSSAATGSVSATGIAVFSCIASDAAGVYVGAVTTTPTYRVFRVTTSTLATASTVTDTTASGAETADTIRISADGSGNIVVLTYGRFQTNTFYVPEVGVYSCSSSATTFTFVKTLYCWVEQSFPFYTNGRHYAVLSKQLNGNVGSSNSISTIAADSCIVDLTELVTDGDDGSTVYGSLRPAGVIDTYTDYIGDKDQARGYLYQRQIGYVPSISASGDVVFAHASQVSSSTLSFSAVSCAVNSPASLTGESSSFSGGVCWEYDGIAPSEMSMVDAPSVFAVDSGGGSGVDIGVHSYVSVYEFRNNNGDVVYSRVSRPSTVTLGSAHNVTVTVLGLGVGSRTRSTGFYNSYTVSTYRTTAGGTVYYRVSSLNYQGTVGFTDSTSDAALVALPQLFRQPGTVGTPLDRCNPLSGSSLCKHKDRVYYSRGNSVYYSSFALDGEGTWFSPSFTFAVPDGTGPVTGLASMDGILIVFKRNAVLLVDGDGPPENGGSGTEFSTPRRIMTEYGCIDPRSIVPTPNGIMYRSMRGIELLNRSLQVQWVGDRVDSTVQSYPYTGGACYDRMGSKVYVSVGTGVELDGRLEYDSDGIVLCYDTSGDVWTKFKVTTPGGYGKAIQDVCYASSTPSGTYFGTETVFAAEPSGRSYYLSESQHTDNSTDFVPWTLETGWIRGTSMQDRIQVTSLFIAAKRHTNHNIAVSFSKDYSDSYTTIGTYTPADLNSLTIQQLDVNPTIEAVQSMKFKIVTSVPADTVTYPVTTGQQMDLFSLTPRLGVKGGGAKLSAAAKV